MKENRVNKYYRVTDCTHTIQAYRIQKPCENKWGST